jgi:hypothetical protein
VLVEAAGGVDQGAAVNEKVVRVLSHRIMLLRSIWVELWWLAVSRIRWLIARILKKEAGTGLPQSPFCRAIVACGLGDAGQALSTAAAERLVGITFEEPAGVVADGAMLVIRVVVHAATAAAAEVALALAILGRPAIAELTDRGRQAAVVVAFAAFTAAEKRAAGCGAG